MIDQRKLQFSSLLEIYLGGKVLIWIDIDKFVKGELKIYPEEIFKYLKYQ